MLNEIQMMKVEYEPRRQVLKTMYNKHRDILKNEDVPSSVAILRELVNETRKSARNHAVVEHIFGNVMHGQCQRISGDITRVYKQVRLNQEG